jgi:hypothetical protein
MGNFHSLNPENYPHVWIQGSNACQEFTTLKFSFDDKPVEIQDKSDLWDRFGLAIDEHLPDLNRNMTPLFVFYFTSLVAYFVMFQVLQSNESYEKFLKYSGIYVSGALIVFCVGLQVVVQKNHVVDKKIESICELFNAEFLKTGFSPEYRTQFTGWCKPRHARPKRLIVFKPTGRTSGHFV